MVSAARHSILSLEQIICWGMGVATLITPWEVDRALVWMNDAEEVTVVRSAWPFSLAFWNCS